MRVIEAKEIRLYENPTGRFDISVLKGSPSIDGDIIELNDGDIVAVEWWTPYGSGEVLTGLLFFTTTDIAETEKDHLIIIDYLRHLLVSGDGGEPVCTDLIPWDIPREDVRGRKIWDVMRR